MFLLNLIFIYEEINKQNIRHERHYMCRYVCTEIHVHA